MSQPTNNTNESTHQLYKWVNPPTIQMSQPTNYTDESTHQLYLVGLLICIVGGLTHLYCWWVDSFVLLVGWLICIVGGLTHLYSWWVDSSTHQLYRWVNPPNIQMSQPTNYTDESTHQLYRWVNPPTIQMSQPTNNTNESTHQLYTHLYSWWVDSFVLLVGWLICIVGDLTHLYSWWVDSSV
jgi:hypothetical protein